MMRYIARLLCKERWRKHSLCSSVKMTALTFCTGVNICLRNLNGFGPRSGHSLLSCLLVVTGFSMASTSTPFDPLNALNAALRAPPNSQEQAELLSTLREYLENHPAPLPILVQTLISSVRNAGDSLLKRWVLELLHFGICRSSLTLDQRTQS